tara:strand:+ start:236 stop:751 length:516 start_codon:yes stop_codon:yes gene_type:complete
MEVEIKNLIFKFNNTFIKYKNNNKFIYSENIKYNTAFKINKHNLRYDTFLHILKNSLDMYIDTNNYNDVLEECFNYFKISSNPLIKRNMSQKISYLIINSVKREEEELIDKLKELLNSYLLKELNQINNCEEINFLKILANLKIVNEKDDINFFDDEDGFTLLDFILDQYE